MSKVKLSENLFLEVAELKRINEFLGEKGYQRAFKSLVSKYGIVRNVGNTAFKPMPQTAPGIVIKAGLAYNSNMEAIVLESDMSMNITNTGTKRWVIISRAVSNYESGTVSISADGTLTGVGTEFTKVLRGQPNFPTKVKFNSAQNSGEYEVVSVSSDTSAVLAGEFTNQSNIQYGVVGTFTPGFIPDASDALIYEHDSCSIRIQDSAQRPTITADEFIVASVEYVNNNMVVTDERIYYMFNESYSTIVGSDGVSPLTSLLRTTIKSIDKKSATIELILEHGYSVSTFQLATASNNDTVFRITSGSCNFLGSATIPNGTFNGWLLVNLANMVTAEISSNNGNNLYLVGYSEDLVSTTLVNKFVVVPNFPTIEYEVTLDDGVPQPSIPFRFTCDTLVPFTRANIYALLPSQGGADSVTVTLRYRFIDNSGKHYAYQTLAIAPFINTSGDSETLAESNFVVDMASIEPAAENRNYS